MSGVQQREASGAQYWEGVFLFCQVVQCVLLHGERCVVAGSTTSCVYVTISACSGQARAATRHNPATCVLRPLPPRAAQVAALHQLGPNYQSPLLACESSGLLDQHPAAAAALALGTAAAPPVAGAGGEASSSDAATAAAAAAVAAQQGQPPKLLLAFCPQLAAAEAQEGHAGASSSSSGRARGGSRGMRESVLGLPAALLPGTQLCRTQQPHSMLHCLGGIAALLPLLEHQPTGAEVAGVVRLVAALLRGSPTNQQAVQQAGGFALMAHLLERRVQAQGPGLLTSELLAAQQQLLGAVNESQDLSHSVLRWVDGRVAIEWMAGRSRLVSGWVCGIWLVSGWLMQEVTRNVLGLRPTSPRHRLAHTAGPVCVLSQLLTRRYARLPCHTLPQAPAVQSSAVERSSTQRAAEAAGAVGPVGTGGCWACWELPALGC